MNGTYQGHDDAFTEWIDGRVGDLGEQLLEVLVHQGVELGDAGQWRVISHGTEGLFPV